MKNFHKRFNGHTFHYRNLYQFKDSFVRTIKELLERSLSTDSTMVQHRNNSGHCTDTAHTLKYMTSHAKRRIQQTCLVLVEF